MWLVYRLHFGGRRNRDKEKEGLPPNSEGLEPTVNRTTRRFRKMSKCSGLWLTTGGHSDMGPLDLDAKRKQQNSVYV